MAKTKQELIEELKNTPDIDPYKHDGSYELVQKAVELYGRKENLDDVDYNDLNLINLFAGIVVNKATYEKYVSAAHFASESDKNEMNETIAVVWEKACKGEYENHKGEKKPVIGMFGLAFHSFSGKTNDDSVKNIISSLVKISKYKRDNEGRSEYRNAIYSYVDDMVKKDVKGVKYSVLSQILHCLKPDLFPILNDESKNIFKLLDLGLFYCKKANQDLSGFVSDCMKIDDYMHNDGINIKNYREIDRISCQQDDIKTADDFYDVSLKDNSMLANKPQLPVNMILYGPPGTGKTYNSVIYAVGIIEKWSKKDIDKNIGIGTDEKQKKDKSQSERIKYSEILKKFNNYKVKHDISDDNTDNGQIEFVTFHQSYGYEEFIEGIKPRTENGEIRYEIVDGVFKKFCKKAENNPDKNYVFIIDEINRGNISKIFGELITLIEDTKRIGASEEMKATLPYSGESFGVPDNVYILGTMNTADRSISLMDTALRRRFRFVEMMPDPTLVNVVIAEGGKELNVRNILETMNKRIEYLYDREHTIGHSFFMKLNETKSMDDLKNVMLNSVLPLLQEYFYDDYNKIRLVLGDNQKAGNEPCFVIKKNDNKNDLFGATDEINDTEVFEINEKAFGNADSYKYLLSGTGSPKHDQSETGTSSENN